MRDQPASLANTVQESLKPFRQHARSAPLLDPEPVMSPKHVLVLAVTSIGLGLATCPALAEAQPAEATGAATPQVSIPTQNIRIVSDQATAVRLDQPVKTVVIGNSSVAEAMLVNDRLIYLQGRIFGTTNLVALDPKGREIYKALVTVGASDTAQVTLYRGNAQFTMVCSPRCERTVTMGDADMEIQAKSGTGKMDVAKAGASLSAAP
jgi:Flp pilus assembly secretin CpaC